MKEIDDEELQNLIARQFGDKSRIDKPGAENEDEQLYSMLFTALSQEPPLAPLPLADNVVAIIEQEQKAEAVKYNAVLAGASAASLVAVVIALAIFSPAVLNDIAGLVKNYTSVLVFIIVAFAGIQYLDKKIVKSHAML